MAWFHSTKLKQVVIYNIRPQIFQCVLNNDWITAALDPFTHLKKKLWLPRSLHWRWFFQIPRVSISHLDGLSVNMTSPRCPGKSLNFGVGGLAQVRADVPSCGAGDNLLSQGAFGNIWGQFWSSQLGEMGAATTTSIGETNTVETGCEKRLRVQGIVAVAAV